MTSVHCSRVYVCGRYATELWSANSRWYWQSTYRSVASVWWWC